MLAAFLIFEISRYTARKDYTSKENVSTESEAEKSEPAKESEAELAEPEIFEPEVAENEITEPELSESEMTESEMTDSELSGTGIEDSSELLDSDKESLEETPNGIDSLEQPQETNYLLFLDAYGESHQMEVNPNVKKHDYYMSSFYRFGEYESYEGDDRYTYRLGIDVSHHNGDIDFNAVKESGIDFVFLRIGYRGYGEEGTLNEDKMFREYIDKAHEAGLDVGCYFYSQAINTDEAQEEAALVLKILKDYKLELPVVFDPENVLDDVARTDNVTGEQFTENTITFCELIRDAGFEPMVYSNLMWEAFQFDMEKICRYPVWYADYEPAPQTPYDFTCWQYSNTGKVPGVDGEVDLDIMLIPKN